MIVMRSGPLLTVLICSLGLGSCAWVSAQDPKAEDVGRLTVPSFYEGMEEAYSPEPGEPAFIEVYDPLTSVNRRVYVFNAYFDEYVFLPIVRGYRYITPDFVRTGVSNFFANLGEIPIFINSVLQFKVNKAAKTASRFAYNSTFGLLGLVDVATHMDAERQDEDLGQTLGFYGLGPGPYIVLPVVGPSSLRDTTGAVGDFLSSSRINVFGFREQVEASIPLSFLDAVQTRDQIPFRYGDLNSPFEYELIRYLYVQSRELKVEE
ncbi:MAG: VacJ family lipoprotein [Saprospiraceae bacterium]|nr:VacJ family lipoprotein [Saprospiraceae bacterium]